MTQHTTESNLPPSTSPHIEESKTEEFQSKKYSPPVAIRDQISRQFSKSFADRIKLGVENWLEEEIVWVPLSEPPREYLSGPFCSCGKSKRLPMDVEVYNEMEVFSSQETSRSDDMGTSTAFSTSMTSQTDIAQFTPQSTAQDSPGTSKTTGETSEPVASTSQLRPDTTKDTSKPYNISGTYIYLCINVAPDTTRVFEVDATNMNEDQFISKIIKTCCDATRWQGLWTMTQLYRFQYHKFTLQDESGHVRIQESCVPPPAAQGWSAHTGDQQVSEDVVSQHFRDYSEFHLLALIPYVGPWLSDRLRPTCCRDFLQRIPQIRPALIASDRGIECYGILAIPRRTIGGSTATVLVYVVAVVILCVPWRVLGGPDSMPRASILLHVSGWIIILYGQALDRNGRQNSRGCWKCFDPYAPRD